MAREVRIATFNLESLDDRPGREPSIDERVKVLRPQLLRLEADVLCLQEVNAQEEPGREHRTLRALDRLLADTPYESFHRACSHARGHAGPLDVHNLVTLSRFPLTGTRQVWHDLVPGPLWQPVTAEPRSGEREAVEWDRPVLLSTLALSGGASLHVINLHLRSGLAAFVPGQKLDAFTWKSVSGWAEGIFLSAMKRAGQALETRLLVDSLFDSQDDALIAVAGDFNATEHETAVRALRGDEQDTGNGRLAGRVMVPAERSVPESERYSVLHLGKPEMLDHILVSRALLSHLRRVEIHNEALEDELVSFATVAGSPESYHAPVVAEFDLPGADGDGEGKGG